MSKKTATAFPLHWPEHWPRTKAHSKAKFKTTLNRALENVNKSLAMFASDSGKKVENILISSNVTLGALRPADPGVAIYFSWDGIDTTIAVDNYTTVEDNLQAIHHCIEADRTKLRHGGINMIRASYRGNIALPPPSAVKPKSWREVLNYQGNNPKEAEKAYKIARSRAHADHGGDNDAYHAVQEAWKQAKQELGLNT